ncbi:metallophosphoesterase [Halobacillus litoralis]|uniref:metallophosphoesterase n=1 Tax=Halobacillus litoralis TaxID=45668 RepID=UPI001CD5932E|nr:metallophosphoesterase [Halobacillus litoralis]MCA0969461.1 metallophosphoesterase [Halobacillus litoralis]
MAITRREFLKKGLQSIVGILGLSGVSYLYARYIEPEMLTFQHYTLRDEKIPASFDDFKILQFSDTHLGFHYDEPSFSRLVTSVQDQQPDLIVFTGDLVDDPDSYAFRPNLPRLLRKFEAPYGKFWIYGNHDHGGYGTEKIKELMTDGGFQLLQNEHQLITKDEDAFALAGVDDFLLGKPDLDAALAPIQKQVFTILLAHEPDSADQVRHYPVDVQLSGHSHGGQIQLPFFGHLVTPPMAEKYVEGQYQVEGLDLFVSRGIGTTRLPYRFLCRPEVSVFHLKSS